MASAKVAKAKKQTAPSTAGPKKAENSQKLEDYEILSTIGKIKELFYRHNYQDTLQYN